ncbi:hypothetical protein RRF57_005368 [Xylaria bambusicola]|uniref:DUF1127 domain-containing protein n=1 Tax=Xylaria bambusicola TaxID=326684 RepID=A0AAN7UHS8_9PEZI
MPPGPRSTSLFHALSMLGLLAVIHDLLRQHLCALRDPHALEEMGLVDGSVTLDALARAGRGLDER